MIKKGSLVQYVGESTKQMPNGRYLFVHECNDNTATVYLLKNEKGKWKTADVPVSRLKEIIA